MVERVLRLNEQELCLIESGLGGFKRDIEETIDHRFDQPSVHIKDYKDILKQIKALLKRIEEVK